MEEFLRDMEEIGRSASIAIDTETTGLNPYMWDELFAVSIATKDKEYFYDFRILPLEWLRHLEPITSDPTKIKCFHNAQFDMAFLAKQGLTFSNVWCTAVMARVEYNAHFKYSLEACGERIGIKKDDQVKKWIAEHNAYRVETNKETGEVTKIPLFSYVPNHVLAPYAKQDARVCYSLFESQREHFEKEDKKSAGLGFPPASNIVELEKKISIVCHKMRERGVRLDVTYCKDARSFEVNRREEATREFKRLTGRDFIDSRKLFSEVLPAYGITPGKTAKGGDSFAGEVLEQYRGNALAESILTYRDANKRIETYFSNYLSMVGKDGRIHSTLRQSGTTTGRFSSSDPNLQNVPKKEDSPYPVRKCFIPSIGNVFVSIDFKQQEYRLMVDYADEMSLIGLIRNGYDVHEATGALTRVDRDVAKKVNFSLLYGSGSHKLANTLGIPLEKAREIKVDYFTALPKVERLLRSISDSATNRKYVCNWAGRRLHFPDSSFSYTAPNHVIQGGCADIMKVAMAQIHEEVFGQHLILNVHDELLFDLPEECLIYTEEIAHIMKSAYPYRRLPMDVSVSIGRQNWYALEEFKRDPTKGVQSFLLSAPAV